MLEAGLVCSRFLHYVALMVLFGATLFPLYCYPNRIGDMPGRLAGFQRTILLMAAVIVLASGVGWFVCTVAGMTGSLTGDGIWSVLSDTGFGKVWIVRLMLATVLLGLLAARTGPILVLSAALLASLAGVGHTQLNDGLAHVSHVMADGTHLLAAGAWLGGLLPLSCLLAIARAPIAPGQSVAELRGALMRFSGMGYLSVAVLVGSGLINSWFLIGSPAALTGTPYGQILLGKLGVFSGMLSVAALNRFVLVPSLTKGKTGQPAVGLVRLRHFVLGEQILGLIILVMVSVLGTTAAPGRGGA